MSQNNPNNTPPYDFINDLYGIDEMNQQNGSFPLPAQQDPALGAAPAALNPQLGINDGRQQQEQHLVAPIADEFGVGAALQASYLPGNNMGQNGAPFPLPPFPAQQDPAPGAALEAAYLPGNNMGKNGAPFYPSPFPQQWDLGLEAPQGAFQQPLADFNVGQQPIFPPGLPAQQGFDNIGPSLPQGSPFPPAAAPIPSPLASPRRYVKLEAPAGIESGTIIQRAYGSYVLYWKTKGRGPGRPTKKEAEAMAFLRNPKSPLQAASPVLPEPVRRRAKKQAARQRGNQRQRQQQQQQQQQQEGGLIQGAAVNSPNLAQQQVPERSGMGGLHPGSFSAWAAQPVPRQHQQLPSQHQQPQLQMGERTAPLALLQQPVGPEFQPQQQYQQPQQQPQQHQQHQQQQMEERTAPLGLWQQPAAPEFQQQQQSQQEQMEAADGDYPKLLPEWVEMEAAAQQQQRMEAAAGNYLDQSVDDSPWEDFVNFG
ncbi:hypothetical protein QBC35DRAFT_487203 [Podospora australis]|uniref:Uncharacterized protein n=1 Tax=Podospora australis TaxID=1536484 RepID=A0AAN7AN17_9PEZI|nr:hypothetical protein QBC35DRAFT_487203 [Podospora australis]